MGSCVSGSDSNQEPTDDELDTFLSEFNGKRSASSDSKLVFMSLSTEAAPNVIVSLFEKAIEVIRVFDLKRPERKFKSAQIKVLMAVADEGLKQLDEKVKSGNSL